VDLTIVAVYLIGITLFGLRFARRSKGADKSLKSYFLADNTIPWWAIALSIVSAETSTLTIISIPGVAYAGDLGFLQIVLGYMLGRVVVALLFLPRYFKGEMLTAYQLIDQRFGHALHKVTAGLFLLTRAAAEGVRVFAISIVVGIAIGTGDTLSIAIISALTLLYTFEGGMAAVIWTDVVQMGLYVAGTLVALWTLGAHVPGGWAHIHAVAAPLGKFHWLDFSFSLTKSYTFWAGVLGGTFLTMASHGTDQLMVQRMLAARSLRESRLALLSSGVVIFLQFTLFLLIGVGLFVFYGAHPQHFASADRIFPTFIVAEMPHGVAGLLVAAILAAAMSNLSAALNSLASTTVIDFYVPFRSWQQTRVPHVSTLRRGIEAATKPRENNALVSRLATVFWAFVLFAIAVYSIQAGGKGHVVETGLSIASVAYGCLLGVFLLGTLTRYATQKGAILGMICGFALNLYLWLVPASPTSGWTYTTARHTYYWSMPKIAFTWYVLIGAVVTFALGSLFSFIFRRKAVQIGATALLAVLTLPLLSSRSEAQRSAVSPVPGPDFTPVSTLINTAIAEHKLPGAVVVIGHGGKVVFEKAYGSRALEPAVEPMTEDTIFDMASLTKVLVTTTAVLQLYEQHKIDLDAPVAKYLPEFAQNGKDKITVRELLTHYSGLPEDVDLKDDWGLRKPQRAEGVRRAMSAVPYGPPGTTFKYSDINFITLGALVEKLTVPEWSVYADRPTLDIYAALNIFNVLDMKKTRYLAYDKVCGPVQQLPIPWRSPILALPVHDVSTPEMDCDRMSWTAANWIMRTAPTAYDDQATTATNPDYDHLLRGIVHDPTARRMGGVAGHAGVFSTAEDMAKFAQALIDKLTKNTGPFPLTQATLKLATSPNEPATAATNATIFTQDGQTTKGVASHGLGWDINTAFSRPRGTIFPIATRERPGSFGHTGFTGTSLWLDPTTDTYVILLSNAIHPRGAPPISHLRGDVATAAAKALGLTAPTPDARHSERSAAESKNPEEARAPMVARTTSNPDFQPEVCSIPYVICDSFGAPRRRREVAPAHLERIVATTPNSGQLTSHVSPQTARVDMGHPNSAGDTRTGIDVLESTSFEALKALAATRNHHLRIGLLANQASLDSHGQRTIDILAHAAPEIELRTLFAPEHGLLAHQDTEHLSAEQDPATHIPVISLYGPKASDKRPKQSDLKQLDAVVVDLQDAGTRFWTYETLTGYFLEACVKAKIPLIVLDRPNPIGGLAVQGPVSDPGVENYNDFMPLPLRHGLTLGELARYFNANANATAVDLNPELLDARATHIGDDSGDKQQRPPATKPGLHAELIVVPMQHWDRAEYWRDTGLTWTPPSPNLKSPEAAILYPAVGLTEQTNVSVGRGTNAPFENLGAPWMDAQDFASYLTNRKIPGIEITASTMTVAEDVNHYPSHGQTIPAVHFRVTDPAAFDSPEFGVELLSALEHLNPTRFKLELAKNLLANAETLNALKTGKDPREIAATWSAALRTFEQARNPFTLY
jgi:SSS family transporter